MLSLEPSLFRAFLSSGVPVPFYIHLKGSRPPAQRYACASCWKRPGWTGTGESSCSSLWIPRQLGCPGGPWEPSGRLLLACSLARSSVLRKDVHLPLLKACKNAEREVLRLALQKPTWLIAADTSSRGSNPIEAASRLSLEEASICSHACFACFTCW